ncbi:MAG TPA: alpha/beta fold hydrolase [Solirubrobacteraceae bacterium]|jgi:pimeloyl-ACP methyl ester carboxylesterase|nr:alpha/beta fold hydrolase [Solirubrobacteraceae bacterium]
MPEVSRALYRAGEGDQLVLLHGFTGTWEHWRPVLGDLVARFEVIAPTLAGHDGGPPFPLDGPLTLEGAADSLEAHLDELGVGVAHLAGNSMGGALALELAARGRALSVTALSPGGGWRPDSGEAERVARFFARQTRLLRATRSQLPRVMRGPLRRRLAFRDAMRHGELLAPADALMFCYGALGCQVVDQVLAALRRGDDAVPKSLERIGVPVLVAWAQHDRILPLATCSSRFRNEIPGVEFRVLPAVGHVPMWDDGRLIAGTIADWAARHSAVRAAPV